MWESFSLPLSRSEPCGKLFIKLNCVPSSPVEAKPKRVPITAAFTDYMAQQDKCSTICCSMASSSLNWNGALIVSIHSPFSIKTPCASFKLPQLQVSAMLCCLKPSSESFLFLIVLVLQDLSLPHNPRGPHGSTQHLTHTFPVNYNQLGFALACYW